MTNKTYAANVKAAPGGGPAGRVEALVSVFGNVDLMGDRVMPGAFERSLRDWSLSGAPIPMVWSHAWGEIGAHVGTWDPLLSRETAEGLVLVGRVDDSDADGAKVLKLLRERRIREFSFAYDVVRERRADDSANELLELAIIEAGPTLKGANQETRLVAVKSAPAEPAPRPDDDFERLGEWLRRTSPQPAGSFRAALESRFAKSLVAQVFDESPADLAAEAREAERARALADFDAVNAELAIAGTLPSEKERDERDRRRSQSDRQERDARESDRSGSAAVVWSPSGSMP